MVDTVNLMLNRNTGVGRRTSEPSSPIPRLNLPQIQPPSIPQMPLGGSSSGAPIEDRPETETDVQFVWTGKDMIEGGRRAVNLAKNTAKLTANTGLMALDLAGRVAETAVDAGNMAVDVAQFIGQFGRSRQQLSVHYEDNSLPMIADGSPREIVDVDEEPEFMGETIDLT